MIGNDEIKIENRSSLSEEKMRSLLYLYRPLLGDDAYILYQALMMERREEALVKDFLNSLNLSIDRFEHSLKQLGELALVLLYRSTSDTLLLVQETLSCRDFFRHMLFSKLLQKELGEEECKRRRLFLVKERDFSVYHNISSKLNESLRNSINVPWEQKERIPAISEKEKDFFDIQAFLQEVGPLLLPYSERSVENIEAIYTCANLYGISRRRMRVLLNEMKKKSDDFNKETLFRLAANEKVEYREITAGEYEVPPVLFLMNKQGGKEITPSDKRILYALSEEYHLSASVINVLLEFALQKYDYHLYANYLYPVAADMHRVGISDEKSAKEFLYKTEKKVERKITSSAKEILPVYDDSKNPHVDMVDWQELEAFFGKEK